MIVRSCDERRLSRGNVNSRRCRFKFCPTDSERPALLWGVRAALHLQPSGSTCSRDGLKRSTQSRHHFHQFLDLLMLLGGIAVLHRVGNAVRDVLAQDFIFDPLECGLDGLKLRHDVDAVPIILDHAGDAADLAFYPSETGKAGFLRFRIHDLSDTPGGFITIPL